MMNNKKYIFYNYPKEIPLQYYNREIEKYIEKASKVEGTLAIYSTGSMECPGISDIDLIIVTNNKIKDAKRLSVTNGGFDKNLFIHEVLIMDKTSFENLQYILYASNLKCLWKNVECEELNVASVPERERSIAIILDFVESKLWELDLLSRTNKVNVRHWLVGINSFRHSLDLANCVIKGISNKYRNILNSLLEIRKIWLEESMIDIDLFQSILWRNKSLYLELLNDISAVPELCISYPLVKEQINVDKKIIKFTKDKNYNVNFKELSLPIIGKRTYSIVSIPYYYIPHLAGYLTKGEVGKCFSPLKNINSILPIDKYREFQKKRITAIEDHIKFLKTNHIYFSTRGYVCFSPPIYKKVILLADYILLKYITLSRKVYGEQNEQIC